MLDGEKLQVIHEFEASHYYTRQCILVGPGSQFKSLLHKAVYPGGTGLIVRVIVTQGSAS